LIARSKVPAGVAPPSFNAGAAAVGGPIAASNARWSINQAGGLRRSIDQGTTWQDVNLNGSTALVADATSYELAKTSRAKEMDDEKKADKKMDSPGIFRAVTAMGSDVWAGGANGLLYHSIDSGAHWLRVLPTAAGISLTGDIVTVEFFDLQHGKIATATAEVWTTADAGLTWQKQ
jgi:photosystem II stability/assembly factor-like uncharacterized protein